ncbi:MAG: NAD/NADP octopine/nopaline dehydrogenase family protein [Deltaproteobacteria bacterium]|nr:NAD/NADP octopine/nopaline dehydrogenase family protein [Deltaproteobacteria bacterium]
MKNSPVIAVLGGGNGAFATAADLTLRGFAVRLFELPALAENIRGAKERGGIELTIVGRPGLKPGFARIEVITSDIRKALDGAQIVLAVVPAFAQRAFAEAAAPHLRPEQLVVLTPGNFGGSLEFAHILEKAGIRRRPLLADMECMIYSGFKSSPSSVEVSGYKLGIMLAAYPGIRSAEAHGRLQAVYPEIRAARNILEIGLSNINTILHAPIAVLNAGRIENTAGQFLFYWQGVTPAVARVLEGVDREKMELGRRLGITLFPLAEILRRFYSHLGLKGEDLHRMVSTNPVYEIDWAPKGLEHRFLLEDIPFGMVPMETLGRLAGVPTPLTTAVINLAGEMLRTDLRARARDLEGLGLRGLSVSKILELVNQGSIGQGGGD